MKTIKTYTALLCLLSAVACTTGFDDFNTNHNEPEYGDITPINMLESLIANAGDVLCYRTWQLNGELIQYTVSGTSNNSYHRYVIPNTASASSWNWFARLAANADEMQRLAVKTGDPNCEAIAITIKALFMSNLTDCYGDVPYTEAFGNINGTGNNQPRFDTQRTVYENIIAELERANTLYNPKEGINGSRDLLYGGDLTKWRKFTNSLYLRVLMRLSNRNEVFGVAEKINRVFTNPTSYPVFGSNDDNATLYYDDVEPFVNYFGSTTSSSFTSSRKTCSTIIDMMSIPGDPRISAYFVQGGERWKGRPSGMPSQETDSDGIASLNRDNLGAYSSPYSFMKYDEVLFIFCEAIKRGWVAGGDPLAEEYYKQAITASIRYWNSIDTKKTVITDKTISNFLAKVPYNNTVEQIINQKYVALFWVGYESWYEYRRTGFPKLKIGTATSNDHVLPTRFQYPDNTANVNVANYQAQLERLRTVYKGDDDMKTPVWWSRQAAEAGIE